MNPSMRNSLLGLLLGVPTLCSAQLRVPDAVPAPLMKARQQPVYPGWLRWDGSGPAQQAELGGPHTRSTVVDTLKLSQQGWRRIKNGLGLDLALAANAQIFLDLYQRPHRKRPGLRLPVRPRALLSTGHRARWSWSAGAANQLVRTESGQKMLRLVPQLRLKRQSRPGLLNCEARIEYGYWVGSGRRAALNERVIQATASWRF